MKSPRLSTLGIVAAAIAGISLIASCNGTISQSLPEASAETGLHASKDSIISPPVLATNRAAADAATIMSRQQVPILCYHQVREWRANDSKVSRTYIVPPAVFRQQMKSLADSGYQTITPDELTAYLQYGAALPEKPVMLTFDDTDLSQYTEVAPELKKHNFKGVFFIMTVSINRPGYMSREQIADLSKQGHIIGSHTWDHQNVKKLQTEEEWSRQIDKPTKQLTEITGLPVKYFAYPFGLWDTASMHKIKSKGFTAAFQLATKRDSTEPMYTVRRIIVPAWSERTFDRAIKTSF